MERSTLSCTTVWMELNTRASVTGTARLPTPISIGASGRCWRDKAHGKQRANSFSLINWLTLARDPFELLLFLIYCPTTMKKIAALLVLVLLPFTGLVEARGRSRSSAPRYSGSRHTSSHGGRYPGGRGSSHK